MSSFNRVILMGNLTRDPELKYIPSGTALCEFSLAVNRRWKDKDGNSKDEVSYLDCIAWARSAEVIAEHLRKGRPILVEGELRQERWTDNGGGNRSRVRINVERFQFIGPKGGESDGPPPAAEPAAAAPAENLDDVQF